MESRGFSFDREFEALTGHPPMSWQRRLFEEHFAVFGPENDTLPHALDIPTGLGKTSVMAIWLLARAHPNNAARQKIPRRLIYVVDRRAVVDQATAEAEKLRENLEGSPELREFLGLAKDKLPISTLRGQHVDNQYWLADPAAPAIIVGTVDMIGSRLLFSGYGVSPKMRPFHAGFLGADTLVILDEAHLVPPFESLLEEIERGAGALDAQDGKGGQLVPRFKLLSLSATGRNKKGSVFRLDDADLQDEVVRRRLQARKFLQLHAADGRRLETVLAQQAWTLTGNGSLNIRCLVYCDSRETAEKTRKEIESLMWRDKKKSEAFIPPELLVGARRVKERQDSELALKKMGFLAGSKIEREKPVFLIATSAGEVGIDLDADHMVCDVVPWERMVQRLGRVNRRGDGDARVIIVDEGPPKPKKPAEPTPREQYELLAYRSLSVIEQLSPGENGMDGSPGELRRLKLSAATDKDIEKKIDAATTPAPLRPTLTRALADAWSMTSLDEHTGRPDIQPWLRGWEVDDQPQTQIVWRKYLPVRRSEDRETSKEINEFFEAASPQTSEVLETETWRVVDWLLKRATSVSKLQEAELRDDEKEKVRNATVLLVLNHKNELDEERESHARWSLARLVELGEKDNKKRREAFEKSLHGRMVVVDAMLCGLSGAGMLDHDFDNPPPTIDTDAVDIAGDEEKWSSRPFALRETDQVRSQTQKGWKQVHRFALAKDDDGNVSRWLVVYERIGQVENEDGRALSTREQTLTDHQSDVVRRVRKTAEKIGLPPEHVSALAIAARLHDEGKRLWRWQRAFNAPRNGVYAKTRGPLNTRLLDGYRHEFASLWKVEEDAEFMRLDSEIQDLVLHLVAAHHGYARPVISTRNCEEDGSEQKAREVALRFARLQKCWSSWGLAWWESLLRAADQGASRANDEQGIEADETASVPGTTEEAA